MQRILVLRGGALGDFIVTLPALTLLRRRWPRAQIELAGNAPAAELACARGILDAVHSQHQARWSTLYGAATTALPAEFERWLGGFDLVLNYWPDPDGELRCRFPVRAGQVFLTASAMPARAPAAAHYCALLHELGLENTDYFVPLAAEISPRLADPSPRDSRPIAIHPGSGSPQKNWPAERWWELIAQLSRPLLLILGPAERDRWLPALRSSSASTSGECGTAPPRFSDGGGSRHAGVPSPDDAAAAMEAGVQIALDLPLEKLMGELARCRLFLGHDSGVSHLAAACGTPSVLLFGPTDPAVWAPPAPHVKVVRRGLEMDSISAADVLAALRTRGPR